MVRTNRDRRESLSPGASDCTPRGGAPARVDALPAIRIRVPLTDDAWSLPPLPTTFADAVARALEELDLELTPGMLAALDAHARLLLAWNPHVNLTGIRDPNGIALEHVADSLSALPLLLDRLAARRPPRRLPRLLDLGSGAGYPGLPVAVAIPAGQAALVDSVSKKAAFLRVAAAAVTREMASRDEPCPRLGVVAARAEDLARDPAHRERWDVVTARAVAPLARLAALALPLVRPGGVLLAWKREPGDGSLAEEIRAAMPELERNGAAPEPLVVTTCVSGLEDHRLVLVEKRARLRRQRPLLP
jgi:16S rRNA (guanine527-N7)-methyltransferase